jgi:hypothetical protein
MIQLVKTFHFLEDTMSKSLFLLSLGALLTFVACEKKEDAKKDSVTVEAPKPVEAAPMAAPAQAAPMAAPAVMPAPAAHDAAPAAPAAMPADAGHAAPAK